MCGIAGTVNWGDQEALEKMTDLLAHRGPDDRGTWSTRQSNGDVIGLGSRRLAILDLSSAGHMPMSTEDKRYTIIYNGEIYNYPELRRWLEARGNKFRSDCDTEAVLYLYRELGPDFLNKLNGMFALAIWDSDRNQLFVARDHFGIKPFYYIQRDRSLCFASEIKSLLHLPGVERETDFEALGQYLTFLWVPDPLTMFRGIQKLPAGHFAIWKDGNFSITKYWDLQFPHAGEIQPYCEADLVHDLRQVLFRGVKSQLLSDVKVGAFLSAGLDSSSILAAMSPFMSAPIPTFTVTFPRAYTRGEVTLDDPQVAQRTAEQFGCQHSEIKVRPDVVKLLPRLIYHLDEPIADPAIIACYLVNEMAARNNVKVMLSGIGGDEAFAGYRKYQAHFMARAYQSLPVWLRRKYLEPVLTALPSFRGTAFKGYVRLAKKMAKSGSLPPRERFIADSVYQQQEALETLCTRETFADISGFDPLRRHMDYFENVKEADFLNQMLYLDIKTFLVSLNLTYNDKMSMASSVEVRVPFLDREMMEWTARAVPPTLKMNGGTTKYILRQAMRPMLSNEVLTQRKAGFGAPVDYWLANDLHEMTDDLLSESRVKKRGMFKAVEVQRLLRAHRKGQSDWSLQIWQLLTLELWMQTFIDSN